MTDGKIEILGQKQIMLPSDAILSLGSSKDSFEVMNTQMRKAIEDYAKKMGSGSGGMLKSIQDIYETLGMGKLQVVQLDEKKKTTNLRLQNADMKDTTLVSGVLCGFFSFLFETKLTQKNIKVAKKPGYIDVTIK